MEEVEAAERTTEGAPATEDVVAEATAAAGMAPQARAPVVSGEVVGLGCTSPFSPCYEAVSPAAVPDPAFFDEGDVGDKDEDYLIERAEELVEGNDDEKEDKLKAILILILLLLFLA